MPGFVSEFDVVVVGSGAAAMAAASAAVAGGSRVVVLEKAADPGGTTAKSSGAYWVPNNSFLRQRGIDDPRDDAVKLMARISYPFMYDPEAPRLGLPERAFRLLEAFYDTASVAIDDLAAIGALRSMPQPLFGEQVGDVDWAIPEYHADLAENKAPYGRSLLPDMDLMSGVLPGAEIVRQLRAFVESKGVEIRTGHRVTGLVTSDGRVTGVEVEHDGGPSAIGGRAVVFGSGGFTHDRAKATSYLRGPIFGGCAVPTNTGDFIDIAAGVGAEMGNLANAFWSQSALEPTLREGFVEWDEDIFCPFGDSMVIVNKHGRRVACEKAMYQERTRSHFTLDAATDDYPNLVQFMVWDQAVADYDQFHIYRYPVPMPGDSSPYVLQGATWAELAQRIDGRLQEIAHRASGGAVVGPSVRLADDFAPNLQATINRFNGFAERGVDDDFGRGSTPIQVAWGSVPRPGERTPNATMRPFSASGPYYCILLAPGTLDTCGGPVVDERARVLRPGGAAIPGLYGAGNCVASLTGEGYWSAGSTLGPALAFGWTAGREARG
ncbi:MAG: fumarate reductase/succinate dehydrogenase flavoprotein domain protein [Acidimicrobiales bacterium]|jgi:3-oxosteroid 1-dehydrogenase|nr:fumarate reductase/succinate dehydrogenase flavoprotein domain protein [Acidimicrobiales bacterium]